MISYHVKLERCDGTENDKYMKHVFFDLIDEFRLNIRGVTEYSGYAGGISIAVILSCGYIVIHTNQYTAVVTIDYVDYSLLENPIDIDVWCRWINSLFGGPEKIKYLITNMMTFDLIDQGIWGVT